MDKLQFNEFYNTQHNQQLLLRQARRELLVIANNYEPRRREALRGVFYDNSRGCFRWIGHAHDYSVWIEKNRR